MIRLSQMKLPNQSRTCDLIALLERCEEDTRRLLGGIAAHRLGNWRRHVWTSQQALIEYVQQLLWGARCDNGRKLERQGGLSLERIVLDHCPDLFTDSDRQQAKRTLGMSN